MLIHVPIGGAGRGSYPAGRPRVLLIAGVLTSLCATGVQALAQQASTELHESIDYEWFATGARTALPRCRSTPCAAHSVETVSRWLSHLVGSRATASGPDRIWKIRASADAALFLMADSSPALAEATTVYTEVDTHGAVADLTPDDPDFPLQWGLHNTGQIVGEQPGKPGADIRALGAWAIHRGTSSIVVAIVGTGVDSHPEFGNRLLEGRSMVGDLFDTRDACDAYPLGTHVAGIIGAAIGNGEGVAGVNGHAQLLPVRVFDGCAGTASATAAGIRWAVDEGADIIIVPLAFHTGTAVLADQVAYAAANDVVVIAPAGDTGTCELFFPAAYDGCLGVAATGNQDTLAGFATSGSHVDVSAPGQDIYSTWRYGGYAYHSGSCLASAFVAGVATLVRSYAQQLSAADVRQVIMDSADDLGSVGHDDLFGAGRVNALSALEVAQAPAIRFEHADSLPTTVPPGETASFIIRIVDVAQALVPNSPVLVYRTRFLTFTPAPLSPLGNGLFLVELPAAPCGSTVEYFFAAEGQDGSSVRDPLDAPADLHSARAIRYDTLFYDDFEEDLGWQRIAEGGDETAGLWVRVSPVGTPAQPGFDYSPDADQLCYVTGQHVGGEPWLTDVDGGPVRLVSPAIALDAPDAEISYARWFHCSGNGVPDELIIELSLDGGDTWAIAEAVGTTDAWVPHCFRVSDFPELAGNRLQVRFSTADSPNDSLTEAAIDEFEVRAILCASRPGDFDGDGHIDLADFRRLSECWTGPEAPLPDDRCVPFDFDGDRDIDLVDGQAFQSEFAPAPD